MASFAIVGGIKEDEWAENSDSSFLGWLLGLVFERDFPSLS